MKIAVWDTYVERNDGKIMHFDILVSKEFTNKNKIFEFGKLYLEDKPFSTGQLTSNECRFCHIEEATELVINDILTKGFYIIEMENCN
jgi:hypothetical protein